MSTVSVLFPQQPTDVKELLPFGRLVQQSSARRLWMGQSLRIESHPAFAYLAGTGCQIPVGLSVGLMALRHPFDAALQARSLAALMDNPVTIGYGAADPNFVRGLYGAPYEAPAAAVEEYVTVARGLLTGEQIVHQGRLFTVDQFLPPMSHPPVEIGAGVLRPAMARAAGRSADAAITWLTPTGYLRDTLNPMIATAAATAGRAAPRVVTVVHVAVDRPGRSPMLLAQHGCGNHLRAPHYTDMLRKAGLDVHASDPIAGARELVEENVYVYGSVSEVGAAIRAHFDAGVDEVILNSTAVSNLHGTDAALADLSDILTDFR
ncbi:LLM class flavin-dependent oxidoreductase [Micromonospora sp. DT228]|uniref:LLM class flavin-dependent oxidoreductase n=1 Tax=Micromonospora sp. DT228 TaxID=3393443 RepID=UPI003CEA2782